MIPLRSFEYLTEPKSFELYVVVRKFFPLITTSRAGQTNLPGSFLSNLSINIFFDMPLKFIKVSVLLIYDISECISISFGNYS